MPMSSREMLKFLVKNGFVKVSKRGSHLKMYNSTTNRTIFIPMHNEDLPKGS
ncbi:MAG: type II toxin-antitoxin system HicA family toxin [Erysipelotrichaceae bacterium]|nr:type II toxin-antitoxin system HicA family toxin [Erysipelotrichaceae bacterium]